MVAINPNVSRSAIAGDLHVLASFMIAGLLSGLLFAWLITRPGLQNFWFIKGGKLLIPRYTYWVTFSLVLLLGLSGAYIISRIRHWSLEHSAPSPARLFTAGVLILLSAPVLYSITPAMTTRIGENWVVVAPLAFLLLISVTMCLLSTSLGLFAFAFIWNLAFCAVGFVSVYAVVRLIPGANERYEFVQWPILESMLALSYGSWLIWGRRLFANQPPNKRLQLTAR